MPSTLSRLLCRGSDVDLFDTETRSYPIVIGSWAPSDPVPQGFHSAARTFDFALNSDSELRLHTQGGWSNGTAQFSRGSDRSFASSSAATSTDASQIDAQSWPWNWWNHRSSEPAADTVHVRVEARYNDEALYRDSAILDRSDDHRSMTLLIKTPERPRDGSRNTSQLSYHVSFVISKTIGTLALLNIQKSPSTSSPSDPIFRVVGLASLRGMCFDRVDVRTSNAPISFDHLEADDIDLYTSNASISGTIIGADVVAKTTNGHIGGDWEGCEKLELHTSNAPIQGTFKVGDGSQGLRLVTKNGSIKARIEVFEQEDEKKSEGTLKVETLTSNGRVEVEFTKVVPRARIDWRAITSNARLALRYPKPFDGTLEMETSSSSVKVEFPKDHHVTLSNVSKRKVSARVRSSETQGGEVNVVASTSNGSAEFVVA